jgi:hypothetical protein
LTEHDFDSPAPVFQQAGAASCEFRTATISAEFRGGMKSKRWRDEPTQRHSGYGFDGRELSAALKVCFVLVAGTQPRIHRLHGHLNVFWRLRFDDEVRAVARNS